MPVLFESSCVFTRQRLTEMTRKARSRVMVVLVAVMFAAVWAVALLFGAYAKMAVLLCCYTAICVLFFFMPTINGFLQVYRFNKLYRQPIEVIVRLYEDHLENYTPVDGGTLKLTYDRIQKIYEGRHAIYLRLEGRFHVLLDPERFTVGTAPEALAFLREKMNAGKD